jgi:hypothetical protein
VSSHLSSEPQATKNFRHADKHLGVGPDRFVGQGLFTSVLSFYKPY